MLYLEIQKIQFEKLEHLASFFYKYPPIRGELLFNLRINVTSWGFF
jgi:hypothetical protein